MKKNIVYHRLVLLAVLALSCCVGGVARAATSTISTCADLQSVSTTITGHTYLLVNDIDCSGGNFTPIENFQATLNGDGYTVRNVSIPQVVFFTNTVGMFKMLTGARIENFHIRSATLGGNFQMGILAAGAASSTIRNVTVEGSAASTASLSVLGGVVGKSWNSVFENVRADVQLVGYSLVGGVVGEVAESTTIMRARVVGGIQSFGNSVGGLVGLAQGLTARDTYAQVIVTGSGNEYGGLVGSLNSTDTVSRSYATGAMSGSGSNRGGLIGYATSTATVSDSYWDSATTGHNGSAGGVGTTTAAMFGSALYTGWDFGQVWASSSGAYPTLRTLDTSNPVFTGAYTGIGFTSSTSPTVTWGAATDVGGLAYRAYDVAWSSSTDFATTIYTTTTAGLSSTLPTVGAGRYYIRVRARDMFGNYSSYATSSYLTVDVANPSIMLRGEAEMSLSSGETFVDPGAEGNDAPNGGFSSQMQQIMRSGSVLTDTPGTYTLTYSVADAAGNQATPVTRRVRIFISPVVMLGASAGLVPAPVPSTVAPVDFTLGLVGGTSTSASGTPHNKDVLVENVQPPAVAAVQAPYVPAAPRFFFNRNLKMGMRGDDVRALQKFLNDNGFIVARTGPGSPGKESGYYGKSTAQAVAKYQEFYAQYILNPLGLRQGTGLLYGTTRQFVNRQSTL